MSKPSAATIGETAETWFENICARGNLIANRSTRDRGGWDYLVEIPVASPDLHAPPLLTCLIQVKGTTSKKAAPKVKLSNWKRLALYEGPAFFVRVVLDAGLEAEQVQLVPVDEALVEQVCGWLEDAGPEAQLHQIEKVLQWSTHHQLAGLTGDHLKDAILKHTGLHAHRYAERKIAWSAQAGYEPFPHEWRATWTAGSEEETTKAVVDLLIGARDVLEDAQVSVSTTRFGRKQTVAHHDKVRIGLAARPAAQASLRVSSMDGDVSVELNALVLAPGTFVNDIPHHLLKFRIVAAPLDLTVQPTMIEPGLFGLSGRAGISPPGPVCTLEQLRRWRDVCSILSAEGHKMKLCFANRQDFELQCGPAEFQPSDKALLPELAAILSALQPLDDLADLCHLPGTTPVEVEAVLAQQRALTWFQIVSRGEFVERGVRLLVPRSVVEALPLGSLIAWQWRDEVVLVREGAGVLLGAWLMADGWRVEEDDESPDKVALILAGIRRRHTVQRHYRHEARAQTIDMLNQSGLAQRGELERGGAYVLGVWTMATSS